MYYDNIDDVSTTTTTTMTTTFSFTSTDECHLCEEQTEVGEIVGVGGVGVHSSLVKVLDSVENGRSVVRLSVQKNREVPQAFRVDRVGGDSCLEQLLSLNRTRENTQSNINYGNGWIRSTLRREKMQDRVRLR